MLTSREQELYLCVYVKRGVYRGKESPITPLETLLLKSRQLGILVVKSPLSRHFRDLDETLHGSVRIYMHDLPDGHVVVLSVPSTLLVGFAKASASSDCQHFKPRSS